jgi:hypothetical protein
MAKAPRVPNLRYSPAVTTPPTPAGWYPDPDGSGGQRYWDGSEWTEHRSPATPEPAEPQAAAEPPGSEQPTADVQLGPTGPHVGAHRALDSTPEPASTPEPEPTAAVDLGSTVPSEQPTSPVAQSTPPAEPSYFGTPPEASPAAPDDRRRLMIQFAAVCAALVAVLVVAVIYAVFSSKNHTVHVSSGPSTSKSATPTTSGSETITTSESPSSVPSAGAVTDGNFSFQVTDVEAAPSVNSQDTPAEKTAQGQFLIVHMTVTNTGAMSATFLGTLQKLKAGGTMYSIDDEATLYLHGATADTNPGDSTEVAVAFDVPPGTKPDAIELHGDPTSPGVEVPLS